MASITDKGVLEAGSKKFTLSKYDEFRAWQTEDGQRVIQHARLFCKNRTSDDETDAVPCSDGLEADGIWRMCEEWWKANGRCV